MIKYFHLFSGIFIMFCCSSCMKFKAADLVIYNAKIHTLDPLFTIAQAIAIKDGKIIELGPDREILNKYNYVQEFDAKTQVIMPGLIDAHCHFLGFGKSARLVDLTSTNSYEEVIEKIQEYANLTTSEWITGRGWDQNDWNEKVYPNKVKLDELFPDRPILVRRIDGHAGLANSKALSLAGFTVSTSIEGGQILQDETGLTGIVIDNALDSLMKFVPEESEDDLRAALKLAQSKCFELGLTTVDDAGLEWSDIELINRMQVSGDLKMKIYAMVSNTSENRAKAFAKGPWKTDRLNVRSFKMYGDGALGSRGACLKRPYSDMDDHHTGWLIKSIEQYKKDVENFDMNGFQVNTHCIGDSAVSVMLNVYKEQLKESNDKRWRIEHAQVIDQKDLIIFKDFNIIPSIQPTHATSDMYWAEDRLGTERVKHAYAYQSLLKQNGLVAIGTDFPVEEINPMYSLYAAVARKNHADYPATGFQMEESLSRIEAILGMTIWAAISNFEEAEKGTLEVGKSADFIVLDRDIINCDAKDILDAKVLATFINGEKVFEK